MTRHPRWTQGIGENTIDGSMMMDKPWLDNDANRFNEYGFLGHLNGDFFEPELLGSLVSRVPNDDHTFGINHDWLPESKFPDRLGNRIDRVVIDPGLFSVMRL